MFHLSLPVTAFSECIAFYRDCFGADVVMLNDRAVNLYVFGGQLTLHDKPDSSIDIEQRHEMHFGHVVTNEDWFAIRDQVQKSEETVLRCVEPQLPDKTRGKLLVVDPSGNIVEINSGLRLAGHN
ncbi:hypothetical protein DM806_17110 [Sphingobium lactosutens]|uniref:VOC family protein n=1 Tax=Sphingobium lactosutens TaxID=522773 RepID=UPI0015BE84DD|nr:VOC family protein [Sphingobium lactosutens]NWK97356.1 hypothetical protein [Sphingobium lactosutens]